MDLKILEINGFELGIGRSLNVQLSYQCFGQQLHSAPIVLVNHPLTGNSNVTGQLGWWNEIIGPGKVIDTNIYSVLAFNIPGNGYGGLSEPFTRSYKDFQARDVARLFLSGLEQLKVEHLFAIIGGSVGGGLAWELAALRPNLSDYLIPIAADWKATDWLIANCYIQDEILNNSSKPLEDARKHAMTFYRTPISFLEKFRNSKKDETYYDVELWLNHHGLKLEERFTLAAYKMVNQILKTIRVADTTDDFLSLATAISAHIHIITINSDLLFNSEENWSTFVELKALKDDVSIGEIKSNHGHDAFLIEHAQLSKLLKPIFGLKHTKNDKHKYSYIRNR